MPSYVNRLEVEALYGSFDLYQNFASGINVIYGHNGFFKTTILHILANILNGDYDRFVFLDFDRIQVELDDNRIIEIIRSKVQDPSIDYQVVVDDGRSVTYFSAQEVEAQEPSFETPSLIIPEASRMPPFAPPNLPVIYYPAFRTVIETWKSIHEKSSECSIELMTDIMRRIFSPFVPRVNYPSLHQIESELTIDSDDPIRNAASRDFEKIVNGFLEGKQLSINPRGLPDRLPAVDLIHESGQRSRLAALSSGEQQIVTMLYGASKSNPYKVFLVDEPEISLHVTWQRILLDQLRKLSQSQQIIACTHSPVIGTKHPFIKIDLVSYGSDGEELAW